MRFCDEQEFGFGWLEEERLARTSHALVAGDGVWLIDPIEWQQAERRALDLGKVRGVLQLLDRHERDCASIARRLGVPHHRVPTTRLNGATFEFLLLIRSRFWREVALWWPEHRVLVCADAVGTAGYFRAREEVLGVHPLLRLRPPRALRRIFPGHVLTGHGEGVHENAARALHEALRTSRRRLPALLWAWTRGGSRG